MDHQPKIATKQNLEEMFAEEKLVYQMSKSKKKNKRDNEIHKKIWPSSNLNFYTFT